jgi:hypothetical protein
MKEAEMIIYSNNLIFVKLKCLIVEWGFLWVVGILFYFYINNVRIIGTFKGTSYTWAANT